MAFFIVEVDNTGFKVLDSGGTEIDPAEDATVAAITTELQAIQATTGIKSIIDPLPAGTNNIGDVDLASAIPAGANIIGLIKLVDTGGVNVLAINASGQVAIQNQPNMDVALSTRATEATLSAADTKLGTIDSVLDSIKDTDGVKKITDPLPAGTNEIGEVAQGTKAANADAWPIVQVDSSGNPATITLDAGVYRQEVVGKVTVVGAQPPPSTTPTQINADTPLTVGSHDTSFTIPNGETFFLQQMVAGNEDPTKGASVEVIFDDGAEHLIARVYTAGETVSIGFSDISEARDGTSLDGNGSNTIIVRRAKFSGTNIAIDAVVTGYTV